MTSRRLIADIETDGLIHELTRIHVLGIKDIASNEVFCFHHNGAENTIPDGIAMLNEAALIIGHNWESFDAKALYKVYGDAYNPQGKMRDTVVMARMLFADEKERDFRRWKRGTLEGKLIGSHELKAWGQRLDLHKGDYADDKKLQLIAQFPHLAEREHKKELNRLVWAEWSQEMEDYCLRDLDVTYALWQKIESKPWPEFATVLEHSVHSLMGRVQENGFPFDVATAHELEAELREAHAEKSQKAIAHFGSWWVPTRWLKIDESTTYVDPADGVQKKEQPKFKPREAFFEDATRANWGEVQVPKRTCQFKDPQKGDTEAGAPYCPVKRIEFNPNSRQQIINRLEKIYGWEPQEFTEKGNPSVNDEVLRDLAHTVPICDELAEIFYYSKRLGQLADGEAALIDKAEEYGDNKIHGRTNVGGTVTNRAAHSGPNIGQIPAVEFLHLKQWIQQNVSYGFAHGQVTYGVRRPDNSVDFDVELSPLLSPDRQQILGVPVRDGDGNFVLDDNGKVKTKKTLMKGRAGEHGWDFRRLCGVPETHVLMGADQKGIELRALGHYMYEFDDGAYMKLVVESDPHELHRQVMEIDSRDRAKRGIYCLIYGGQDYKFGITIDPTLAMYPARAKTLGAEMRRRIMTRIPAFGKVVERVQREARRGYLTALDGRPLYVRAKHSALNTLLQGAAATIAKLWCCYFEQFCEDDGLIHSWDGDFAILAWVHDELQTAVRDDDVVKEICRKNVVEAAAAVAERLSFNGPIDIDTKFGRTWAETH